MVWDSLYFPKLFANSCISTNLLKCTPLYLKQAVSLARMEQDPLMEILNLWSFLPSENLVSRLECTISRIVSTRRNLQMHWRMLSCKWSIVWALT